MPNGDIDLGIWKCLLTVQRSQQYWVQPIKAELKSTKIHPDLKMHIESAAPGATYGLLQGSHLV